MNFWDRSLPTFLLPISLAAVVCSQPARASGVQAPALAAEKSRPSEKQTIEPIDINRASVEDFTKLPGIGPALARRIVAFREKHGPFRRVEDLLAIRGIGHKKWKAIRAYLKVGDATIKK